MFAAGKVALDPVQLADRAARGFRAVELHLTPASLGVPPACAARLLARFGLDAVSVHAPRGVCLGTGLPPPAAVCLAAEPALRAWLAAWMGEECELASRASGGGVLSALFLVLRDLAGRVPGPLLDPGGWPSFAPFPSGPCARFPVLAEALSELSGSVPLRARVLRELLAFSARVLVSADASAGFAQGNYSRDALRVKWVQRAFNVLWQRAYVAGAPGVVDLADLPVVSREVDGFLRGLDFFGSGR